MWRKLCVFRYFFFIFTRSLAITRGFWLGGGDSRSAAGVWSTAWRLSDHHTQYGKIFLCGVTNWLKKPLSFKRLLICEPSLTVEAAIAHPSYGLDQGRSAALPDTAHCTKDKYMDWGFQVVPKSLKDRCSSSVAKVQLSLFWSYCYQDHRPQ